MLLANVGRPPSAAHGRKARSLPARARQSGAAARPRPAEQRALVGARCCAAPLKASFSRTPLRLAKPCLPRRRRPSPRRTGTRPAEAARAGASRAPALAAAQCAGRCGSPNAARCSLAPLALSRAFPRRCARTPQRPPSGGCAQRRPPMRGFGGRARASARCKCPLTRRAKAGRRCVLTRAARRSSGSDGAPSGAQGFRAPSRVRAGRPAFGQRSFASSQASACRHPARRRHAASGLARPAPHRCLGWAAAARAAGAKCRACCAAARLPLTQRCALMLRASPLQKRSRKSTPQRAPESYDSARPRAARTHRRLACFVRCRAPFADRAPRCQPLPRPRRSAW